VIIMTASASELEEEIAHLRDLDLSGLRARWRSVFRRKTPDHLPRHLLYRMIALSPAGRTAGRSRPLRQLQTISRSCLYKLLLKPPLAAKGNSNRHKHPAAHVEDGGEA
jgi:hypothetical protein